MKKFKKLISLALSLCVICSVAVTSSMTVSAEFSQSSYAFSQNMTVGFNIGNSLDSVLASSADETYWGCPKITQGFVQSIKDKGFDVIRIPVTWGAKIDSSGNFSDNSVHANRVKQVVDWAYNTGAYVILNTHHEMSWLNTWASIKNSSGTDVDNAKLNAMLTRYGQLWKNIANTYKNYGERLIFEGYNETRSTESTWSSSLEDREVMQKIGQKFIDSVRATGGNNAKRYLLLNTFGACFSTNEVNNYLMPTDPADHLLFGVHTYDPHSLCFREYSGTTFSQNDFNNYYNNVMPAIESKFLSKGYGVILGEFGAVNKNNDAERVKYTKAVVTACSKYGVIPVWWDSGVINKNDSKDSFGLVNRKAPYDWPKDNIASAMINLANQLASSRPGRGGATQTRTTARTTSTTNTPSSGQTTKVVFTDWTGTIAHVKTEGWGSHSTNITSGMNSAVTRSGGTMKVNTSGFTFDSNLVQVEMSLDTSKVRQAINAAKTTDGYLTLTIKLNSVSGKTATNSAKFRVYCFANDDWQNSIDIVGENDVLISAGNTYTHKFHVDNLNGMIPDTIAVNAMNEYYNNGITGISYEISSITAEQAGGSGITTTIPKATTTKATAATSTISATSATSATSPTSVTSPSVSADSTVIDWEDGDTSIVSSSTGVVTGRISSNMTIAGSTKALEISSSNWDEKTGNNYVKISLDQKAVKNARDIKVNIGSNATTGNKAHFGIIMNGKVYWDMAYIGGSVAYKGYEEVSLLNKKFVSLKNNQFSTNGAYDVQVTVKASNIVNITALVISPANHSNMQKVYVDDITIIDKNDIPTVSTPSKGAIFCDWTGNVNFVKTDGWDKHSTNLSEMPNALAVSGGMLKLNTRGYSFDSLMVQTEITLNTAQVANAIKAARENDGYLYMKIRFNSAYNANGNECGVKFKVYCFANDDWQNSEYIVGENDAIASEAGEQLIKYHVDNLNGMIPDTIAIIVMDETYYNGLSAVNVEFSDIFATGAESATSATVKTTAATKPTTVNPTIYGDLNRDGKVYLTDLIAMRKHLAKWSIDIDETSADCNADGKISLLDLILLRKYLAKWSVVLGPQK